MIAVDLNCDMGEGMANDAALMPYISSANIACGYHAGDEKNMKRTVEYAVKYNVAIGAHPGFADKENFGRFELLLSANQYYHLVTDQLFELKKITDSFAIKIHHVKPHGALYNMAAKDKALAATIASAVHDFDPSLILYGLSGSYLISEAKAIGLKTANEVFADRTYNDEGKLTPRNLPYALIEDVNVSMQQVLRMVKEQTVLSVNDNVIPILAETICIHGDGKHVVQFAKTINHILKENNIELKPV